MQSKIVEIRNIWIQPVFCSRSFSNKNANHRIWTYLFILFYFLFAGSIFVAQCTSILIKLIYISVIKCKHVEYKTDIFCFAPSDSYNQQECTVEKQNSLPPEFHFYNKRQQLRIIHHLVQIHFSTALNIRVQQTNSFCIDNKFLENLKVIQFK